MWCLLKGKILTGLELMRRGLLSKESNHMCVLCKNYEESLDCLFCEYLVAKDLWGRFVRLFGLGAEQFDFEFVG